MKFICAFAGFVLLPWSSKATTPDKSMIPQDDSPLNLPQDNEYWKRLLAQGRVMSLVTGSPTLPPTSLPTTDSPTPAPHSPPPSVRPSISPTKVPSPSPTLPPSPFPTISPTTDPPTLVPTLPPTPQPSFGPTTNQPTPPPSNQPTPAPTPSPVISPTSAPTVAPFSSNPSATPAIETCDIDLDVSCTPVDKEIGQTCKEIVPRNTTCAQAVTDIQFRYRGGPCILSSTPQPFPTFVCEDLDFFGPPTEVGTNSFVVVSDRLHNETSGHILFSQNVLVGDYFQVSNEGEILPESVYVFIYESEGDFINGTDPLQWLKIGLSCEVPAILSLKDVFGAMILTSFTNDEQGVNTCFLNISLGYTISNLGDETLTLTNLVSVSNNVLEMMLNLTDQVDGEVLSPSATFNVTRTTTIDPSNAEGLSLAMPFVYSSQVTGVSLQDGALPCQATDIFDFLGPNQNLRTFSFPSFSPP